ALLAVTLRLTYHPVFLSFLFLALTLYLLNHPGSKAAEGKAGQGGIIGFLSSKPVWFLPLLFIIWVNVDSWFILGPITVGLYLLGEVVQKYFSPISTGPDAREPGRLGTLTQVFVVSLLACLVSPFHYHALTLPPQLSYLLVVGLDVLEILFEINLPLPSQIVAAGQTLQTLNAHDPFTFLTPVSPFTGDYVDEVKDALRIAGLAYYVLLSAGVVSFILLAWSGAVWVWGRFFVWL